MRKAAFFIIVDNIGKKSKKVLTNKVYSAIIVKVTNFDR